MFHLDEEYVRDLLVLDEDVRGAVELVARALQQHPGTAQLILQEALVLLLKAVWG